MLAWPAIVVSTKFVGITKLTYGVSIGGLSETRGQSYDEKILGNIIIVIMDNIIIITKENV